MLCCYFDIILLNVFFYVAAFAEMEGKFGPGVGPIYLDDVKCSGTESHILECSQLPLASIHNCAHSEDATVACPGEGLCESHT